MCFLFYRILPVNCLQRVYRETRFIDDKSMWLKMSATIEINAIPRTIFKHTFAQRVDVLKIEMCF